MALKEKIVTAALVVSSWLGAGTAKAAPSEAASDAQEANVEVVMDTQQSRHQGRYGTPPPPPKKHLNNVRKKQKQSRIVQKIKHDYRVAKQQARINAVRKMEDDKRMAQEFARTVANALVIKYQIDHGRELYDYIPDVERGVIDAKARKHSKKVYRMLRSYTNEDIIYDYMGQALEGVAYDQQRNVYYYKDKEARASGNLLEQTGLRGRNQVIGGQKYGGNTYYYR